MWQDIKNIYHLFVAILANIIYGFPGRKLRVIGVTGTDGKTTTVYLIYHLLKTAGYKVAMVSSIGATINDKIYETGFHVTTPSSFSLQKFLRQAKKQGSEYFVLEVTSHALDQNRIWGIPFEIGLLTNITNEHLDYHKTYNEYLKTKAKLLLSAKTAIINRGDKSFQKISKILSEKRKRYIAYGASKKDEDFNVQNFLAAEAVCRVLGLTEDEIKKAVKNFNLPKGRMDYVYDSDFSVVIDFAHTPNAFAQVLSHLRKKVKGKIIHVFGSAGERDKTKRPEMGKISSDFANIIILTSEDPRRESVEKINNEIIGGIKNPITQILKIPDRQKAIEKAVEMAQPEDLVLLTGKAHEKSINLGHGEDLWDEYEAVKKALEKRGLNYD